MPPTPFFSIFFWILILPVALILNSVFSKVSAFANIPVLLMKRFLFVLLASLVHMLLFAGLMHLISALFYEHTFTFLRNLRFSVSEDLYKYLLIYSVIALVLIRKKRTIKEEKSNSKYID